jgi:uncharacterized protein
LALAMKLDLDRQALGRSQLPVAVTMPLTDAKGLTGEVQLAGSLTVDNLESRIVVTGEVTGTSEAACDRCLAGFSLSFSVPLELLVIKDSGTEDQDDSWVIHQKTGEVDLREQLREAALLALPQKLLCCEECKGLCPQCGINLNAESCQCTAEEVDPRWDGLPDE